MKKIISIVIAALSANLLIAAGIDFKAGPWITNVSETEATIMWATETLSFGWVEMGEDDGSPFHSSAKPRYYETYAGRRVFGTLHTVKVSGLAPGTKYTYRIVSKKVNEKSSAYDIKYDYTKSSKTFSFKTLDHSAGSCSFSVVNDMHFDVKKYATLMKDVSQANSDFMVLNGDIVSFSSSLDTLLSSIIKPVEDKTAILPVIYARGNHETRGLAFQEFGKLFPTCTGELYHTFRQGPVAFVVLDAGEDKPDINDEYFGTADFDAYREKEAQWLKDAVKAPEFASAPVKICIMHIPTLNEKSSWYTQRRISEMFTPILNEAGVQLMLCGHEHKHFVVKPRERGNADYTIIVNSNKERMDVKADAHKVSVRIHDVAGTLTHSYDFDF